MAVCVINVYYETSLSDTYAIISKMKKKYSVEGVYRQLVEHETKNGKKPKEIIMGYEFYHEFYETILRDKTTAHGHDPLMFRGYPIVKDSKLKHTFVIGE